MELQKTPDEEVKMHLVRKYGANPDELDVDINFLASGDRAITVGVWKNVSIHGPGEARQRLLNGAELAWRQLSEDLNETEHVEKIIQLEKEVAELEKLLGEKIDAIAELEPLKHHYEIEMNLRHGPLVIENTLGEKLSKQGVSVWDS